MSPRGLLVAAAELDTAIAAGVVRLGARNVMPVLCCLRSCRQAVEVGDGRTLWLDGHRRGFLCRVDRLGIHRGGQPVSTRGSVPGMPPPAPGS